MNVVILADGKSKESHMGNHRLLTPIKGEPLLYRTVRQFSERGAAVTVITSDGKIIESVAPLALVTRGGDKSQYGGVDMIRKGLGHIAMPRTVIVFGDVVFTDEAIDIICDNEANGWAVYGRSGANPDTAPYGEYFAIEINDGQSYAQARRALQTVVEYWREGEWPRATPWEWYFEMESLPYYIPNPRDIRVGKHWVEINDMTDDIDFETDVERIEKNFG